MKSTMTRRDFLKLSGLGAAGAAASLMFAACAKQEATPNAQNEDAATAREASKETAGDTADLLGEGATNDTAGRGDSEEGSVAGKDGKRTLVNFCANKVKDMNPFAQRVPAAPVALVFMKIAYDDGKGGLASDCCEEIEQVDFSTYRLKLYKDIVDQKGNPFTADDLKYCMDSIKEVGFSAQNYSNLDSVTVEDDYTAVIKMNTELVSAFPKLANATFLVTRKSYEESGDNMSNEPVGFTQYKVVDMVPSSYIDYDRIDDYWQTDKSKITRAYEANVDYIHYIMLTEASQIIAGLQTGDIHMVTGINYQNMSLLEGDDRFKITPIYDAQMQNISFNMTPQGACANDINLRKAIFYGMDRQALVDVYGKGKILKSLVPAFYNDYNEAWLDEDYFEYDPEKAKEFLKQSNYKGETLRFLTNPGGSMTTLSELFIACMSAIGIKVEPAVFEQATYGDAQYASKQQYDICVVEIGNTSYNLYDAFNQLGSDQYSDIPGTTKWGWDNKELVDLCNAVSTREGRTPENRDRIHEIVTENAVMLGMITKETYAITVKEIDEIYVNGGIMMPNAARYSQDYNFFKE